MGKLIGSFSDDERADRPDLNQCPDCKCLFESDVCPLCGKECPENMKAGNRPVVKKKKKRNTSGTGRVTFISWYHSWWFIILMLIFSPVIGIVLAVTSPHERWKKVVSIVAAVALTLISTFGFGNIISSITDMWDSPVDDSLTKNEYISKCEAITPEQFYRSSNGYENEFISVKLQIAEQATYVDSFYNDKDYLCYLCEAEGGSDFKFVIRDCLLDNQQKFIAGDVITVYGEGAGECEVYDDEYNFFTASCLNMAYVIVD